jgi:enoyl-[acyl-carrier-protein] reductase (NADH)
MIDVLPELAHAVDVSALSLVRVISAFQHDFADSASVIYHTSIGASRVIPGYGSVGIAKAAAEAIVRYLAVELGPRGIRVNAVCSGPVATKALQAVFGDAQKVVERAAKLSPLQPPVEVEELASCVAALCSPSCRGVTGQVVVIDGASSIRM